MGRHLKSHASLSVCALSIKVGNRTLIRHLTHIFAPGELWCIAGPNGAGKTTLIATLAGLHAPTHGAIELDARHLAQWPLEELARRRTLLTQSRPAVTHVSVWHTVLLARYPHGMRWGCPSTADQVRIDAALDLFGLTLLAKRDVHTLSGGEQKRVALAAAFCQDAPLMLLDEPLAHLDWPHQIACLQHLRHWLTEGAGTPRSVIFSCHDINLARHFATHALLLDGTGGTQCGLARETLSPGHISRVFGHPFRLVCHGQDEVLIPAL